MKPARFGSYLLIDHLSRGGMAEVYLGKETLGSGRVVAIKRILPLIAEDSDFRNMFVDEARISTSLDHPGIGDVYEFGEIDGGYFLAMEYIAGQDVRQIRQRLAEREEHMPVAMALHICTELCAALEHAHRKTNAQGEPLEIVHRDVSPPNVLISYDGHVKLIDFGIARAASRLTRTRAGKLKGKFAYMSPEQVEGLPLDQRSDIFSAGTVLFEMLTHRRPFRGESEIAVMNAIRKAEAPPPSTINPEVPLAVDHIVAKALARDRRDRFQWASELHAAIEGFTARANRGYGQEQLGAWMVGAFADELAHEATTMARLTALTSEQCAESLDLVEAEPISDRVVSGVKPDTSEALLRGKSGPSGPMRKPVQSLGSATGGMDADHTDPERTDADATDANTTDADRTDADGTGLEPSGTPIDTAESDGPVLSGVAVVDATQTAPPAAPVMPRDRVVHDTLPSGIPRLSADAIRPDSLALTGPPPPRVVETGESLSMVEAAILAEMGDEAEASRGEPTAISQPPAHMAVGAQPPRDAPIFPDGGNQVIGGALESPAPARSPSGPSAVGSTRSTISSEPSPHSSRQIESGPRVVISSSSGLVPVSPSIPHGTYDPATVTANMGPAHQPHAFSRLGERIADLTSTQVIVGAGLFTLALVGVVVLFVSLLSGNPKEATGSVLVSTTQPAACTVTVDSERKGQLPTGLTFTIDGLRVGKHVIALDCPGFEPYTSTVMIKPDQVAAFDAPIKAR